MARSDEMNRAELPRSAMAACIHLHAPRQTSVGVYTSGPQMGSKLQQGAFFLPKIPLDNPRSETQGNFLQNKIIFT